MNVLEVLSKLWPIVLFVFAAVSGTAVALYLIRELKNSVGGLQMAITAIRKDIETKLFKDGQSIFMPREGCKDCRDECRGQRTTEYDRIIQYLVRLEKKIDRHVIKKDSLIGPIHSPSE